VSNATRKQQAKDKADGKPKKTDLTIWDALGVHCSANERRADEASRDVEAWLKCYFMQDKLGEEFTGTITGVTTFGVFVQLDTLFVEGLVHVTELGTDYFQYDDARHELRGERTGKRYQLTDRLTVQVARVDLETRKIDLRLVTDAELAGEEAPAKPNGGGKRKGEKKSMVKPGPATEQRHEIKASGNNGGKPGNGSGGRSNGAKAQAKEAPKAAAPKAAAPKRSKKPAAAPAAAAPRAAKTVSKSSKNKR
jgi:ribonuclease R